MTPPFSMTAARAQSTRLASAAQRAHARARRILSELEVVDNRVSFGRLVSVVVLLAILAALFPRWDVVWKAFGVLGFVVFFFLSSFFHKRLLARITFWKGVVASLGLMQDRMARNLKDVAAQAAPWHERVAQGVPAGHVYASDLDAHTHLFTLLDTCSTHDGSQTLFDVLMREGTVMPDADVRRVRGERAEVLSRRSRILREMEALRFDEDYLAAYLQWEEQTKAHVAQGGSEQGLPADAPGAQSRGATVFRYAFAAVGILAWGALLIPGLARFVQDANLEDLVSALMRYAPFPLAGLAVFHGLVDAGNRLKRKTGLLKRVLVQMRGLADTSGFTPFSCSNARAEAQIGRLNFSLELMALRGNPVLWFFLHLLLPFDALAGLFLTRQMQRTAPYVDAWWDDVREFDFVCALGRFAAENPTCRFLPPPSGDVRTDGQLTARELGHPLIPHDARVSNSFVFSKNAPLVLLTGSNMAGKSTFLRTLGINTLLYNMGAPVCAEVFQTAYHKVLCAIRVDDSLSEGTSYFYAEVKRLRVILGALAQDDVKALFLVDEIFRGTNNRERFLGSWHLLRALLGSGTFGVVSTHDLALATLAEHDGRLRNMHFREQVVEGRLAFDYLLREGPCPTTNALHIMRAEGLPIPHEPENDPALRQSQGVVPAHGAFST